jgi:hypothetical protein
MTCSSPAFLLALAAEASWLVHRSSTLQKPQPVRRLPVPSFGGTQDQRDVSAVRRRRCCAKHRSGGLSQTRLGCLRAADQKTDEGLRAILATAAYIWEMLAREIDEVAD